MILLITLVSCGKEDESKFSVPKESFLIGKIRSGSKKITIQYFWSDEQVVKIEPCRVTMESQFNWESYKTNGLVKSIDCYGKHPVDAVLHDENVDQGIKPSYSGIVGLKTEYDFEYPSKAIVKHMVSEEKIGIKDFINQVKAMEEGE